MTSTCSILVIDDDAAFRALIDFHLEGMAASIQHSKTGREGLHAARHNRPDCILLDLDLPDASGLEILRSLKDDTLTSLIPVLFVSADSSPTKAVAALDLGAADYIRKPFDPAELRARVRASLRTIARLRAIMAMLRRRG